MIRLGARECAVDGRPQRNLAEQTAEVAVHLVLALRRVVDGLLSGMRAARQPFRVDAQRLAGGLHEHAVGRIRPFSADAFLAHHRELVGRIAVRTVTDIERHGERIECLEERSERGVIELCERAALRGRAQPARLLRDRHAYDFREIGRQGDLLCRTHGAGRFLCVQASLRERQHARDCHGGGMPHAVLLSFVHRRRLPVRWIVQPCFAALILASSSSRNARRRILPTFVCGSASRNSTNFGIL